MNSDLLVSRSIVSAESGRLVSVIVPCFNGGTFIAEAIESALHQTYRPLEVIVVDDGSTDGSSSVIDSFGSRIKVIRQRNRGLPSARNAGIAASHGTYVAFLDCDDYWHMDFASRMVAALEESGAAIAYCGWQNIGLPGQRGDPFVPPDYESDSRKLFLLVSGVRWPVHAAMVRRDVIDELGGFDPKWTSCEDFEFWIRTSTCRTLVRVPSVLAFYRHHGEGQMTKKRAELARNRWLVQMEYFRANPNARAYIGDATLRQIAHGGLLERGYMCFWDRDLEAAHKIFRWVMRTGYGTTRDWKYMLPALLPLPVYRRLLRFIDRRDRSVRSSR
jgi:glycosyltransferase involved in cell wall biosynthesis